MHKLQLNHFVATVTSFIALIYLVCAFALYLAPKASLQFFSQWFHGIDLTAIAKVPTLGEIILGFFTALVATIVLSAVFVWLWNYFYTSMEVGK